MTDTKGRQKRAELVAQLKEKIEQSNAVVFTDYQGLSAQEMSDLRLKLRDQEAEAGISKNTLLQIALDQDLEELTGPTMAIYSYKDPVASVKVLFEFAEQNNDKPIVKGGIVEGKYINATDLEVLSNLPSKEQLLAQVVGGLNTPITGFVGVLGGVQRSFVRSLAEIARQKEGN